MFAKTTPLRRYRGIDLYRHLHPLHPVFLWESSATQEKELFFSFHRPGRYAYIGLPPYRATTIHNGMLSSSIMNHRGVLQNAETLEVDNPFSYLESQFATPTGNTSTSSQGFAFVPQAVGFLAYDSCRFVEQIRGTTPHPSEPDVFYLICDTVLVLDYEFDSLTILAWNRIGNDSTEERATNVLSFVNELLIHDYKQPCSTDLLDSLPSYSARFSEQEFLSRVIRAKDYIIAGDIFQVVLSNSYRLAGSFDPRYVYEVLKRTNPSPYHFLIPFGSQTIVGASPEVLLRGKTYSNSVDDSHFTKLFMRPVAGTYPRDKDPATDLLLAQQLAGNEKERAEHIMLVDLERNDIGRVSQLGSVLVEDLCSVETYSHVHHLVSQISGLLNKENNIITALRSCFPIGTLAGTPKIRAMEIIAELEQAPRGIFGGAVFMISEAGDLDAAVAIRSVIMDSISATIKTGAGIVYDSVPQREFDECLWKARALFHALSEAQR